MRLVKDNGEVLSINLKFVSPALLWVILLGAGYTLGANFPELNPMQLIECDCNGE